MREVIHWRYAKARKARHRARASEPGGSSDDDDMDDGIWWADPDVPDEERDFPFYLRLEDVRHLHSNFLLHAAHCL